MTSTPQLVYLNQGLRFERYAPDSQVLKDWLLSREVKQVINLRVFTREDEDPMPPWEWRRR